MAPRIQLPAEAPGWAKSLAVQIDKASRAVPDFLGLPTYITVTLPDPTGHVGALVYNQETGELLFSNGAAWVSATGASGAVLGLNLVDGTGAVLPPETVITAFGESASTATVGGRAAELVVTAIDDLVETYGETIAATEARLDAQAAATDSEAARLAALAAQSAAEAARSNAETQASAAGQSAVIAEARALAAQTSAGAAEIARAASAASAVTAEAASVSALSSETLSAEAAGEAVIAAATLFPDDFSAGGRYFSAQITGLSSLPDLVTALVDTAEGRAAVLSAGAEIRPKGVRGRIAGRVYRVSARLRRRSGAPSAEIRALGLNVDGSVSGVFALIGAGAPVSAALSDTFLTLSGDYTAGSAAAYLTADVVVTGGEAEIISLSFSDVTDLRGAEGAAASAEIARVSAVDAQTSAVGAAAQALVSETVAVSASRSTGYLRDPLFLTGIDGWTPANAITLVDGSPRAIEAASAITIRWPGTYAIGARGRIDVSADVIGAITLAVVWRDAAGVETRAVIGSGAAGRIGGIQTAPAGTIGLRVEGDCAAGARLSRPQIAAAASEQVQFAAFLDPQDAQTTRILSDRIASAELGLARTRVESQAGGASASASIALSTSAALDGRLSAIAGVQTEVAGRAGGIVIANDGSFVGVQVQADGFFVRGVSGAVIAAFREASGGGIELADTMIRSLLVTPVGGGPAHRVALRPNRVSGQHGQAIIYSAAYSAIPLVEYAGQPPALAAGESYFVGPGQSTTTGFVVRAVKFTPGSSTVVNTGFGSAAGGTPISKVNKPAGASAFDNQYQFTGEASAAGKPQNVFSGDQQLYSGTATISFYYLINGVSTLVTTLTFSNDGFYSPEDTFGSPEIAIPFAATIQIAQNLSVFGAQFGVNTTDAAITAFTNVSYTTQTASNESVLAGQFTFDVFPPG